MKIYTVENPKPYIKALIYAPPGVGKTSFAAGAMDNPDMSPVLFINIEGGLLSVAHKKPLAIDIGRADDGSPNKHVVKDLEQVIFEVAGKKGDFANIKTIIVDSVSELQTIDLEDVVSAQGKDVDLRNQAVYGTDTVRLKRVLRMLKDLKVNVIFTALSKSVTPEGQSTPVSVQPALTDKVGEALMGYVDFVWYMYKSKDDEKRFLLTSAKGPIRGKTRNAIFYQKIGQTVPLADDSGKNGLTLSDLYTKLCEALNESR